LKEEGSVATKKMNRGSAVKPTVKKRTLNSAAAGPPAKGEPAAYQDSKRRLGNFEGSGEHARVGGRTSGIVGQTTKKLRTTKKNVPKTAPTKKVR
jgi:hypothetical protein